MSKKQHYMVESKEYAVLNLEGAKAVQYIAELNQPLDAEQRRELLIRLANLCRSMARGCEQLVRLEFERR